MKTFEEWELSQGFLSPLSDEERDIARDAWNFATEQARPRWISVSERLPDKAGYYPALRDTSNEKWFRAYFYPNRQWDTFDGYTGIVTHWLELPE
jgi:hypothetical protein